MKPEFFFNIEIFGTCNLRCPSCPTGNYANQLNPKGAMSPDLLRRLLDKAISECEVTGVGLFNWNEPVLHPKLPEMIRIVKSRGLACSISSNLNHFPNMEAVMEANPDTLRISNSGFRQENYGRTHRGGDIERVKKNMEILSDAKKRTRASTNIHVLFHRYKDNQEDELLMKQFAENLGFSFEPAWAFMMPLEKILAYATKDAQFAQLSSEDHAVIDSLALPLDGALAVSKKYSARPCPLRENQMTIDISGRTQLCCAVFDLDKSSIGSYLDTSISDLQAAKHQHSMCGPCMNNGVHIYSTYGTDELDLIAEYNIGKPAANIIGLKNARLRKLVSAPFIYVNRLRKQAYKRARAALSD